MTDTITLRKALELAVRQNSHDMLMTGEEIRLCEAALAAPQPATAKPGYARQWRPSDSVSAPEPMNDGLDEWLTPEAVFKAKLAAHGIPNHEPQPVKQANWLTAARLVVEATPEQLPLAIDALRDLVEGTVPQPVKQALSSEDQQARFDRWYNHRFYGRHVDGAKLAACESAWFAALEGAKP